MQESLVILYARSVHAMPFIGVVCRKNLMEKWKVFDIPEINIFSVLTLFEINRITWEPDSIYIGEEKEEVLIHEIPCSVLRPRYDKKSQHILMPPLLPTVFFVSYIIFDREAKTSRLEAAVQPMEQYMYQHAS